MRTTFRRLAPLLALAALAPCVRAETPKLRVLAQAGAAASPEKIERHINIHRTGAAAEMEKVAFLGVATGPVSPTLTAQLGLPKGTGLVVSQIMSGSPAAGVLEPHDILLKLDDQLLIEPGQFAVLVRNHKEGDEVTLTYLRAGKQATAKVKLAVHDAPKLALSENGAGGEVRRNFLTLGAGPSSGPDRQEIDRVLSLIEARDQPSLTVGGGADVRVIRVNTGNSTMVFSDDEGTMEITSKDGKKTLVAKDAKGAQIFDGPVTTADERKALPPALAARLSKLEGMQEFNFKTGDDFKGGDVKILTAPARRISLPLPPAAPAKPAPIL